MRATLPPLIVAVLLAGCTDAETAEPRSNAPVIKPGRPGEPGRTLDPGEAATAVPTAAPNAEDVRFMQDMIIHHRQALDMSALAPARADSDSVKRLAGRIQDAQKVEISAMAAWLKAHGQRVPSRHADHWGNHPDMPGMATPEQMEQLRAARGAAFDRLFLTLMITHHQGALPMTRRVLSKGSHTRVQEVAEDIAITQTAEIQRMRRLQQAS